MNDPRETAAFAALDFAILPFGDVDASTISALGQDLQDRGARVRVLPPVPILLGAYDAERGQYRADVLLREARSLANREHLLAVTDHDLYVGALNFVFGVADAPGQAAIISLHRLRSRDPAIFRRRMLTEAVHELAHTFGLSHCLKPTCVMYFSRTLTDTDAKGSEFCRACALRLHRGVPRSRAR
jgi:archaemetzincin